jgi:hypothetical protein
MLGTAVLGTASVATAQTREPLCVTVESRRLASGSWLGANGSDRLVARPLLTAGANGERFVVAVRDPEHTLHTAGAPRVPRGVEELGFARPPQPSARPSGLTVIRVGADLRPVGEAVFVPDPVANARRADEETVAPGIPVGVSLGAGVLVLQHVAGDVYATVVPSSGAIPAPRRVAQSPTVSSGNEQGGFVWLTATPRGDGAIALAGTEEGDVVAMRFDRTGALVGEPGLWTQRVGGPMQLLPTGDGPIAALLGRPVRGTGPENEQARVQVLVPLTEGLQPANEPVNTGFAQFPMAYTLRGRSLILFQWAQQQGVAIATLPVGDRRIGEQLPRLWYANPPLEGLNLGQDAILGPGNIVYNVVAYGDPVAGGVHGHVGWLPPSGQPTVRRDVLPVRARVVAPPQLLPAEDGVVVVMGTYDETGGAVDAYHVRCDLVTLPAAE